MVRRNTWLAPHQPSQQRKNRRHQQPPLSSTMNRPRLHQPHQLPSPTTPDNMTPTETSQPKTHVYAQGRDLRVDRSLQQPKANTSRVNYV
jgi:hypothetical protein